MTLCLLLWRSRRFKFEITTYFLPPGSPHASHTFDRTPELLSVDKYIYNYILYIIHADTDAHTDTHSYKHTYICCVHCMQTPRESAFFSFLVGIEFCRQGRLNRGRSCVEWRHLFVGRRDLIAHGSTRFLCRLTGERRGKISFETSNFIPNIENFNPSTFAWIL